jgi:hypothetical protein
MVLVWFGEETRLALLASLLLCCDSLLGVRRARLALGLGFLARVPELVLPNRYSAY